MHGLKMKAGRIGLVQYRHIEKLYRLKVISPSII